MLAIESLRKPNPSVNADARPAGFRPRVGRRLACCVRPHTQYRNSHPEDRTMTKYLVSFPGPAMDIPAEGMAAVGEAAHAVIREAKDAGVYVFGGGINEDV